MRAISLVNRVEFQFVGNVARNALTLGDVDNDGCNELIIGSNGEVAIFKGREKVQTISDLSFVTCVAVGDILNKQKNSLVIITSDGWCYIYDAEEGDNIEDDLGQMDGQGQSSEVLDNSVDSNRSFSTSLNSAKVGKCALVCIHVQRIPANAKNIVLGDIDNDGQIEMILGLTDRVVRSYRWLVERNSAYQAFGADPKTPSADGVNKENLHFGKFVALNKWECANQIGSITLHHSVDGKPTLLIAQPGGTFMRIKCQTDEGSVPAAEKGNLERSESNSSNATSENMSGSAIDYQYLGLSRMRNQNISTEILGDFKTGNAELEQSDQSSGSRKSEAGRVSKRCPYAVATLDGTIMLVQDEIILWAIAVDHQVFALTKLDVTGNGTDDIVVCSWDGQTYILDQDKNSVRFHLNEPVQAFHSGFYSISTDERPVTCLVYVTFKNTVILYYDIPLTELMCKKYEPKLEMLSKLYMTDGRTPEEALECVKKLNKKDRNRLIHHLLYNVKKS